MEERSAAAPETAHLLASSDSQAFADMATNADMRRLNGHLGYVTRRQSFTMRAPVRR